MPFIFHLLMVMPCWGLGSPVISQINYEFGAKHMLDTCGILVPMNLIFRAQHMCDMCNILVLITYGFQSLAYV